MVAEGCDPHPRSLLHIFHTGSSRLAQFFLLYSFVVMISKRRDVMAKTILVVDDEERLRMLVKAYLTKAGYRVVTASDGREALFVAREQKPDLIVLDVMMPNMDGYEFLRLHNKERSTPVIMLTAKVDEHDTILGLELGADDYMTKPFSPRELTARVKAVLRRLEKSESETEVLRIGELTLDRTNHFVKVNEQFINLTPSEFQLLAILMANPGRAFSRSELLERIQGDGDIYDGYDRTVDVHIKNVRAKIKKKRASRRYIETVYGVGYRLKRE